MLPSRMLVHKFGGSIWLDSRPGLRIAQGMSQAAVEPSSGWVGLVISEIVRTDCIEEYRTWSAGICEAARKAPGFRARQVIEPRDESMPEYLIILKFDTRTNMDRWHESAECRSWLEKSETFIAKRTHHHPGEGMEIWFARPESATQSPPFWKQVVMGTLAVYPSIILLRVITTPILGPLNMHPDLNLLISVVLLSCLLTWPLMPWLTWILSSWLYPKRA